MASQPVRADDRLPARYRTRSTANSFGPTCYRLNVIAVDVTDTVRSAGGWLFDRSMAGWDVNVFVADPSAALPLQILGLRSRELTAAAGLGDPEHEPEYPVGLAIATAALAVDPDLRDHVSAALRTGLTEVAAWGDGCAHALGAEVEPVRYRLSDAARAFKGHALRAVGDRDVQDVTVDTTETLFRGGYRRVDSDLTP
jgi:hypothetical protein